jgi:glycosyltransferase involved in cell wall biosynthesis
MITGMHPDRHRTARIAIDCFKNQSYIHKELVIINHGNQGLNQHDDARIREIMITKKPGETIGDLRNLGLQNAKGDLIITWDDDDWHDPDRIAFQVAAQHGKACVLLKHQFRFNVLNQSGFCITDEKGIPGTILFPLLPHLKYESILRGEDLAFLKCFDEAITMDNDPLLHIRTYDGLNVCDADEVMQNYANINLRDEIRADEAVKLRIQNIVPQYIPRWPIGMKRKSHHGIGLKIREIPHHS